MARLSLAMDLWEIRNFGSTSPNPNDDPDIDGFSNLRYYRIQATRS